MYNNTIKEGKTAAIISYLWWIGLLISFIMNNSRRNTFTSFHIRQSIGISIFSFGIGLFTKFGFPLIGNILFLSLFVLWVIGILGAIKGEEKSIPLVGDLFQDWFKSI